MVRWSRQRTSIGCWLSVRNALYSNIGDDDSQKACSIGNEDLVFWWFVGG
jgi:hypothetical protein